MSGISSDYSSSHFPQQRPIEEVQPQQAVSLPEGINIESYKAIYNVAYPGEEHLFLERFNHFMAVTNSREKALTPDEMLEEWFRLCTKGAVQSLTLGFYEKGEDATALMIGVCYLMINMIDVLQEVTVAQTAYLGIYTKLQELLTDLMHDVPTPTPGDDTPLGGSGEDVVKWRNEANAWAARTIENLRAQRSTVMEEGKMFQTSANASINFSKDYTNIGTKILETMNSIRPFKQ